jgi:DNA-binding SARP family transcriptional activator
MLLLSANRDVSRDRHIDELLDGAPADRAEPMLRVQISRLRGALDAVNGAPPRVISRAPGYVLRVEPGELDLHHFEKLLDEGHVALEEQDFERAARVLRAAESLWHGRPLADLEFERFAKIDIERLEELRLVAGEDRIDAELALGRHAMLVPELETLVAEHPLRERARGQLMLALYRSGRQADALECYRSGRALLSDELALEPGPPLRKLERAILRHETVLELPRRSLPAAYGAGASTSAPSLAPAASVNGGGARTALRRSPNRWVLIAGALGVAVIAAVAAVLATSSSRPQVAGPIASGLSTLPRARSARW